MKKSFLLLLLLPLVTITAFGQESRQDISVSGSGLFPPAIVGRGAHLHNNPGKGVLISYRYLLTPRVFTHLERIGEGAGGEIQLTDGIARLMHDEAVYAYRFAGKRFDCGSKIGYLQANVEYALAHPELKGPFKTYLRALTKTLK